MAQQRFGPLRITLATSAALLASACDRGPGARVCADQVGRRIDDSFCRSRYGGGGFHYMYLGRSAFVPAIGGAIVGASLRPSAGGRYAPAPAGGVVRGGFGMSARAGGGGGGEGGGHGGE